MLADQEITDRIIGAAIQVHKTLGPGFLEAIYEAAFATEFDQLGFRYERPKAVRIEYRSKPIGEHRLDFLVEDRVIVELKAIQGIEDMHFAIVRTYLKATHLQSARLLNFAAMPLTIKRVGREESGRAKPSIDLSLC